MRRDPDEGINLRQYASNVELIALSAARRRTVFKSDVKTSEI